LRNRNTIEFLGIWEQIYNPAFKPIEFERFKSQAGLNSFSLSPKKWIENGINHGSLLMVAMVELDCVVLVVRWHAAQCYCALPSARQNSPLYSYS
jgi:hypothetical protein